MVEGYGNRQRQNKRKYVDGWLTKEDEMKKTALESPGSSSVPVPNVRREVFLQLLFHW